MSTGNENLNAHFLKINRSVVTINKIAVKYIKVLKKLLFLHCSIDCFNGTKKICIQQLNILPKSFL